MNSDLKLTEKTRREFLSASTGLLLAGAAANFSLPANSKASPAIGTNAAPAPGKPQRVIIDTDPGVDDAMAILLALHSPELKIEAITPVSGNVPLGLTLPNALRLLEIAGRTNIPVAPGASTPLVRRLITATYAHGENGLGGVEFPAPTTKPVSESATEIIRRLVRSSPGEITIIALGPLTNVATALKSDQALVGMIHPIALMGGSLSGGNITPSAEFNFYVDPEAARIVFDSGVRVTMVGLDVTRKVQMREEHVKALEAAKNPVSQAAGRIMRNNMERIKQSQGKTSVTFAMHDPLTVAHLIDPGILTLSDYYVSIETSGELTAGESVGYTHGPTRKSAPLETAAVPPAAPEEPFRPNAQVATEVDSERFFHLLLARLTGAGS